MKNTWKKLLALIFAAVMMMGLCTLTASAAVQAPKTVTVYRAAKSGGQPVMFYVQGLGTKQSVAKSSVKVSNTAVATRYSVSDEKSTYNYRDSFYESGRSDYYNTSVGHSSCITLMSKKAGTVKVTYKIGTKTYTTTVKILQYVNPVKSITFKGVNGGKSFAAKSKSIGFTSGTTKITGDVKNAPLVVTAASGWKIQYVSVENYKTGFGKTFSARGSGVASAKLLWPRMRKGQQYEIYLEMMNTSTKGRINVTYLIG